MLHRKLKLKHKLHVGSVKNYNISVPVSLIITVISERTSLRTRDTVIMSDQYRAGYPLSNAWDGACRMILLYLDSPREG